MLSRKDTLRQLAENLATDYFVMMLNPVYRGSAFNYQTYDIERYVSGFLSTNFHTNFKVGPTKREVAEAARHARYTWDRWVKQAGEGLPRSTK